MDVMRGWRNPPFEVALLFAKGQPLLLPPGTGNFKDESNMVRSWTRRFTLLKQVAHSSRITESVAAA